MVAAVVVATVAAAAAVMAVMAMAATRMVVVVAASAAAAAVAEAAYEEVEVGVAKEQQQREMMLQGQKVLKAKVVEMATQGPEAVVVVALRARVNVLLILPLDHGESSQHALLVVRLYLFALSRVKTLGPEGTACVVDTERVVEATELLLLVAATEAVMVKAVASRIQSL